MQRKRKTTREKERERERERERETEFRIKLVTGDPVSSQSWFVRSFTCTYRGFVNYRPFCLGSLP